MNDSAPQVIRSVAERMPDVADPRIIANAVIDEFSGRERDVLLTLLPRYVRDVLRRSGRQVRSDEEAWQAFLAERLSTSDGYKFVRQASAADLDDAAARRTRMAGALDERAGLFTATASKVRQANVAAAGDIGIPDGAAIIRAVEDERLRLRRHRMTLAAARSRNRVLEQRLAELQAMVDRRSSPTIVSLKAYRDRLRAAIAVVRDGNERGKRTDEIVDRKAR